MEAKFKKFRLQNSDSWEEFERKYPGIKKGSHGAWVSRGRISIRMYNQLMEYGIL